jgi:hypothetical protein
MPGAEASVAICEPSLKIGSCAWLPSLGLGAACGVLCLAQLWASSICIMCWTCPLLKFCGAHVLQTLDIDEHQCTRWAPLGHWEVTDTVTCTWLHVMLVPVKWDPVTGLLLVHCNIRAQQHHHGLFVGRTCCFHSLLELAGFSESSWRDKLVHGSG